MENSKEMWKIFTNPLWNFKKIILKKASYCAGSFYYNIVKTVRQQLSRMVLSNFLPSLSLSNIKIIFHSFQLHVTPRLEPLHYRSQSTQLLCLGSSCWLPKLFSVQEVVQVKAVFSTTIFFANSPKVIGPCCWLSSVCFIPSPLDTLSILGRSFFGSAFHLNPLPSLTLIFFQLQPVWLSKREKYSAGIISL